MKRLIAVLMTLALLFAITPTVSKAAGSTQLGELLITSEKTVGAVGDVVRVNFFLFPNLPDARKLDTISGTMKYDSEFVTLGAINQMDEEANLTSLMKGKASSFQYNIEDNGVLRFAFVDAYGVDAEGFWFQAEFRIEKEGATDFVFNGIQYTGIDADYHAASFYIEPFSVGGIYTEGENVPEDGAAGETFAPLTPAVETPPPVTPTPMPSSSGHTVPITSTLPTYSSKPTPDGIVTPQPAVTPEPAATPEPQTDTPEPQTDTPTPATPAPATPAHETSEPATQQPATTETAAPQTDAPMTEAPETDAPATEAPETDAPATEAPETPTVEPVTEETPAPETTDEPEPTVAPTEPAKVIEPVTPDTPEPIVAENIPVEPSKAPQNDPASEATAENTKSATNNETGREPNKTLLLIGLLAAVAAVVGLGVLAIVLILKRRKMSATEETPEAHRQNSLKK